MAKKDYFEEYFAPDQGTAKISNDTIGTNNQRPREARRIWKTLNSVEGWVKYRNDGYATDAMAGLLVTVIGDGDNNGVYMITYADPVNAFYQSEADANGIIRANAAYNTTLGLVKVADAHNINGLVGTQIVADSLNLDDNPSIDPGHYVISTEERKLVQASGEPIATYTIAPGDAPAMASDVKAYVDATSVLQESITVMGDGAGNMTNGKIFEAGITLAQALKQIFVQEVITKATNPTITFTAKNNNVSYSGTYEVGVVIPALTLNTTIKTYGYYESYNTTTYPINLFIEKNPGANSNGQLNAVCGIVTGPTYKEDGTVISGTTVNGFTITEGTTKTIVVNSTLGSSVIPNTNLGNPDTPRQITNAPGNSSITFSGKYNFYLGICQKKDTIEEYRAMFPNQASLANLTPCAGQTVKIKQCNINNATGTGFNYDGTDNEMQNTADKTAFVLVLPEKYNTILTTRDGMGNIPEAGPNNAWLECGTIDYVPSGGDSNNPIHYHLRVFPETGVTTYRNITFGLNT